MPKSTRNNFKIKSEKVFETNKICIMDFLIPTTKNLHDELHKFIKKKGDKRDLSIRESSAHLEEITKPSRKENTANLSGLLQVS